jgi:hypothetical protein
MLIEWDSDSRFVRLLLTRGKLFQPPVVILARHGAGREPAPGFSAGRKNPISHESINSWDCLPDEEHAAESSGERTEKFLFHRVRWAPISDKRDPMPEYVKYSVIG